jgi:thioredoxin 1
MKMTIEVSQANFQNEVINSVQPVIVDFWAEWCGPCKMIAPMLEEVATEHAGRVKVTKVNVDENSALAEQYHIKAIPTLLFFLQWFSLRPNRWSRRQKGNCVQDGRDDGTWMKPSEYF